MTGNSPITVIYFHLTREIFTGQIGTMCFTDLECEMITSKDGLFFS